MGRIKSIALRSIYAAINAAIYTALLLRFTWEKEANSIFEAKTRVSSVMWPKEAMLDEVAERCLYTTLESPSKMTSWRPISMAKVTDLRQAIASKSSTDGGRGTLSDSAAITKSSVFRITTPNPAQFKPWKIAPSQLGLSCRGGGESKCVGWNSAGVCSGGSVAT